MQQQLLETIDIMIEKKINNLKFDKTVKGTVIEILENNHYKVSISGITCTLKYTKEKLSLYSGVYILIPNNDYKNMFILCTC